MNSVASNEGDDELKRKKRQERLESNRISARESRKRKKTMIEELQKTVIVLSRENKELNERNEALRRQLIEVGTKHPNLVPLHAMLPGSSGAMFDQSSSQQSNQQQPTQTQTTEGQSFNNTTAATTAAAMPPLSIPITVPNPTTTNGVDVSITNNNSNNNDDDGSNTSPTTE